MSETDLQTAVEDAFTWVHRVYRESRALLREANELAVRAGLQCWEKSGKPYEAQSSDTVYLIGSFYSTPEEFDASNGTDVFISVSFYPDSTYGRAKGPRLVVGTAARTLAAVAYGIDVMNVAARAPATAGLFRVTSRTDDLVVCTPTDAAKGRFPGIGEVRSVALPLTLFRTSEELAEVIDALVALRKGDEGSARRLLEQKSG